MFAIILTNSTFLNNLKEDHHGQSVASSVLDRTDWLGDISDGAWRPLLGHRPGEKQETVATGMPRIHRRARNGPPAGADAQRPLCRAHGSLHAELAILSRSVELVPGSP